MNTEPIKVLLNTVEVERGSVTLTRAPLNGLDRPMELLAVYNGKIHKVVEYKGNIIVLQECSTKETNTLAKTVKNDLNIFLADLMDSNEAANTFIDSKKQ